MAPRERHYTWEWWFDAPPARVWPLVSDTNRVDRLAGLPPATYERVAGAPSDGLLSVKQTYYGLLHVAYEEDPFEWVEGEEFAVERRFQSGPVTRFRVHARLVPDPRGTRVVMDLSVTPRSALSALLVPMMIRSARKGHDRAYAVLQQEVVGAPPAPPARRAILAKALARLAKARDPLPPELATLLSTHVASADASDLQRIRPFALADRWGRPRRELLAAALHAVRAGVLELSWDSLCPHCRGAKRSAGSLSDVRAAARCDACGIDFEVEWDKSLEAVFRPAADLRRVSQDLYCLGGPRNTPHVVAQLRVPAGGESATKVFLEAGAYRARLPRRPGAAAIRAEDEQGYPAAATVELSEDGPKASAQAVARGQVRVTARNPGASDAVLVLERLRWLDDVATAMDVVSVPGFRDLFAKDVLAPGERIAVRRVAILFTDLRESTALYRRIGDAAAYAYVRDHFRVLSEAIRRRNGMLVKTIGDAVMAAFREPAEAVAAAVEMHAEMAAMPPPDGCPRPVLKSGVHLGPSIVVNAGGAIDYFGTTSNLAARAQHESRGHDLVATDEVLSDEDVQRFLATVPHRVTGFQAALKGFDGEVSLHRIELRPA